MAYEPQIWNSGNPELSLEENKENNAVLVAEKMNNIEQGIKTAHDEIANIELQKGDKGDKGDTGLKGDTGDTGPKGDKGDPFTYEDFTPEQLSSLKGDKGDTGLKGDKGDAGNDGFGTEVQYNALIARIEALESPIPAE